MEYGPEPLRTCAGRGWREALTEATTIQRLWTVASRSTAVAEESGGSAVQTLPAQARALVCCWYGAWSRASEALAANEVSWHGGRLYRKFLVSTLDQDAVVCVNPADRVQYKDVV